MICLFLNCLVTSVTCFVNSFISYLTKLSFRVVPLSSVCYNIFEYSLQRQTVQKEAEAAKVATRMVRRKAMEEIKGLKEDLSKDDVKRLENCVQIMTDQWISQITNAQNEKIDAVMNPSLSIRK